MNHKVRLVKLEQRTPRPPKVNPVMTDEMYNRAMDTLTAALSEMIGTEATRADVDQALQQVKP